MKLKIAFACIYILLLTSTILENVHFLHFNYIKQLVIFVNSQL